MESVIFNKVEGAGKSGQEARLVEIDIMKFYGILLVVLGHVAMIYSPMSLIKPQVSSDLMVRVKEIIYSFHMPLFIFVSGCVFAYQLEIKKRQIGFASLFKTKFRRLMIPYYVFGFCWVLPVMVILGFRDPLHYAIDGIILALDPRHLWFVMSLFGIFLLFYSFRSLCLKINFPFWIILVIGFCLYILPVDYPVFFQIKNIMTYFIWFALGYFFILHKKVSIYIIIIALLIIAVNLIFRDVIPSVLTKFSYAVMGISIAYLVSIMTCKISKTKLYRLISHNSFGIYLFHAMIIYIVAYIFRAYTIHPFLLSIIMFFGSLILSILFTVLCRKVGWGRIIGEK